MSTKYGDKTASRYVADDIAMTDHALFRYSQRTPHDCDLDPRVAWQRGEWIKHPTICQADEQTSPPQRVRLYRDAGGWGLAFLVVQDLSQYGGAGHVVATVNNVSNFDHKPARAYLEAHDVHGGGDGDN